MWAWTLLRPPGQPRAWLLFRFALIHNEFMHDQCTQCLLFSLLVHAFLRLYLYTVVLCSALSSLQMVIWGHPSTTGFDSIDYYLSSQLYYKHTYQPSLPLVATPASIATESPLVGYAQDYFLEQLVQFETLGFYFERPQLDIDVKKIGATVDDTATEGADSEQYLPITSDATVPAAEKLALTYRPPSFFKALRSALKITKSSASKQLMSLISRKTKQNTSIALIPQHMPKFHPHFDVVLTTILLEVPNSVIVLVGNKKKFQWRRMLMSRWQEKLRGLVNLNNIAAETSTAKDTNKNTEMESYVDSLLSRIVWLDSLTPSEYLALLAIGDVMLDPFPFGGGVTTLESVAVCTPVVTLPSRQSVPQLAAGTYCIVCLCDGDHSILCVILCSLYPIFSTFSLIPYT